MGKQKHCFYFISYVYDTARGAIFYATLVFYISKVWWSEDDHILHHAFFLLKK